MWFALIAAAWADTLQLDNGAVLVGRLAAYDRDGECRIEIAQGDLSGAAVVVECSRIARFERSLPPPLPAIEPEPEPEPAIALAGTVARPTEPAPAAPPPPAVEPPLAVPAAEADIPVEIVDHPTEIPEDVEVPADAVSETEPPPSDEPPARRRWYDELPTFSDPFRK